MDLGTSVTILGFLISKMSFSESLPELCFYVFLVFYLHGCAFSEFSEMFLDVALL